MARNDDGFNLEDMMEIFGDAVPASPKRPVASEPVRVSAPPAGPAPGQDLTDDEQSLLKAYEQRKQEQRLKEEARRKQELQETREREERRIIEEFEQEEAARSGPKPLTDIDAAENEAFCMMLDQTRTVMLAFLVPLIGIKATTNMLNKSVEKARTKAPEVLKDANWQPDGTLREDGSVDPERLLKNAAGLPAASRVDDYLAGLHELVELRIRAVEAGLGAGPCADMKGKLQAARPVLARKFPTPTQALWVEAFFSRVLA